jgi:hypothetical protein
MMGGWADGWMKKPVLSISYSSKQKFSFLINK